MWFGGLFLSRAKKPELSPGNGGEAGKRNPRPQSIPLEFSANQKQILAGVKSWITATGANAIGNGLPGIAQTDNNPAVNGWVSYHFTGHSGPRVTGHAVNIGSAEKALIGGG